MSIWGEGTGVPSGVAVAGFARVALRVPLGRPLAGYSIGGSGRGEWTRNPLCARAMYLRGADGASVLLAVVDLMSASRYLHEKAAALTRARLGLGADRLILCGTHTHTGPGGFYGNSLYDVFASHDPLAGFDRELADGLAAGVAAACEKAVEEATPATVRVDVARLWGVSRNRSLGAFQRNEDHLLWTALPEMPGHLPPPGLNVEQQAVDPRVVVLSAYDERQARIGVFATFACHATANGPRPTHGERSYYDPDWPGAAARRAEQDPEGAPVVMVALSGAGDQTALPPASGGLLRGPLAMGPERAEWVGAEVAGAIAGTNRRGAAGAKPPTVRVRAMRWWTTAHPDGDPRWNDLPEAPLAPWCFGASTLAGSEEGRSGFFPDLAHEGMTSATAFPPSSVQHPKAPALGVIQDVLAGVASLRPSPVHALNLLRVNDHVFATVPGEPTAWAAHQIAQALVNDAGAAAPATPVTASVVGYAGDYAGYFTTRDEFRAQHYEGASTLFGLASTDHLIERLRAMARAESVDRAAPPAPVAFDLAPRVARAPGPKRRRPHAYAHAEGSRVVGAWVARPDEGHDVARPTVRELRDGGGPEARAVDVVRYAVKDLSAWGIDGPVHVVVARVEGTTAGRAFALRRGRSEVEARGERGARGPARTPVTSRTPTQPARFSAAIATWNSFGVPQARTGSFLAASSIYPARYASDDLRGAVDGFDVLCAQELIGEEARAFFDGLSPYAVRKRVGGVAFDDHGLGVATRLPVEAARSMHFDERGVGTDRLIAKGALHLRVRLVRGPAVDVVTTHLQAGGEADRVAARRRQIDELVAFVRSVSDPARPLVVCGDFNVDGAAPDRAEYAHLAQTLAREGLVDLDAAARLATVHPARNDLLRQLEPGAKPERLDYVFWRAASVDPFAVGASRVALVADHPLADLRPQWGAVTGLEGDAYASDHFGLRVVLSYVPAGAGPAGARAPREAAARGPAVALPVAEEAKVLRVGETDVRLVRRTWGAGGVVHLNVHDDENTSVQAAEAVLSRRGGTLVELRHGGGRRVAFKLGGKGFDFDPNRVFTDVGAAATVKPAGSKRAVAAARAFGDALLAAFDLGSAATLVALHNNSPDAPLTVETYATGKYKRDAAAVTVARGVDPDDFFLVTTRGLYDALAARGFHVVLQDNAAVADDGSLSVVSGRRGVRYVNVEAQHGHLAAQERMLEAALEVLAAGA